MPAKAITKPDELAFIQGELDKGLTYEQIYYLFTKRFQVDYTLTTFMQKMKITVKLGILVKGRGQGSDGIPHKGDAGENHNIQEMDDSKIINLNSSRITNLKQFREWLSERLDLDKWKIHALKANTYEGQQKIKHVEKDDKGHIIREWYESKVIPMYSFKADIRLKDNIFDLGRFFETLGQELKKLKKTSQSPKKRAKKRNILLEPFITDHHIGSQIEGGDGYEVIYNIDKAAEYYDRIIDEMLSRVDTERLEEIWLPTGNDLIHCDNNSLTTTKGTKLIGAQNYERAVIVAETMLIRNIEKLKKTGAKIRVIMVRGNHDWDSVFHLGRSLIYVYDKDRQVKVITSRKQRIYQQFHRVGIGFSHGYHENPREFDRIFSVEAADIWASSMTRQFHIGHLHTFNKKTSWAVAEENLRMKGLDLIRGSTVCFPDQWHDNKAFIGKESRSQFLTFDHDHMTGIEYVNFSGGF